MKDGGILRQIIRKLAPASFGQNCYGYATGKGYWINPAGFDIVLQDEYTVFNESFCFAVGVMRVTGEDHAIRIDECCEQTGCFGTFKTIKVTTEKNGPSPIYQRAYGCPPGVLPWGTIYKPKQ